VKKYFVSFYLINLCTFIIVLCLQYLYNTDFVNHYIDPFVHPLNWFLYFTGFGFIFTTLISIFLVYRINSYTKSIKIFFITSSLIYYFVSIGIIISEFHNP